MSAKLKEVAGAVIRRKVVVPASNTILKDQLLMIDATNSGLVPATSSAATTTLRAVAQTPLTSTGSASSVEAIFISPVQLWEIDCTSNTASNQLWKRHALTDGVTVNNSSSEATGTTGVAEMVAIVGAASDKKALFRLHASAVTA